MSTEAESAHVVVVESEAPTTRHNGLEDLAALSMGNGNPFEPTISKPDIFIESTSFSTFTLNRTALAYGFKTFGVVRNFCRIPVDDAFSDGLVIEIPEISDPEAIKELHLAMEENDDLAIVKNAETWRRLFGGSGLVIVTDQHPGTPLKEDAIKKGDRLKFIAADRWELTTTSFDYGSDEFDRVQQLQYGYTYPADFSYYGVPLDSSRVIRMIGQEAPSIIRQTLQGWGLSELEQAMREINVWLKMENMVAELVDEAKIDVYKIEEFNQQLDDAQGTAAIHLRISLGNWLKNFRNAIVMDKEDEYDQKQIAFGGLADIFQEYRTNLCAALRIPENKLFGQSSTGFASGEDSLENYNKMVEVEIRDKTKRIVRKVVELRCRTLWGFAPKSLTIAFKPLRVLNGVDEEIVKTSKQKRATDLYDRDLMDGQEVSESLKKDGLLNVETAVERGEREPVSPLQMQQQETEASVASLGDRKKERDSTKENGLVRLRRMFRRAA